MKNVKGNKSIRLYNKFVEENSEYKLSVDELYLYSVLRRLINRNEEVVTNMDVLEQYIKFYSKQQKSREYLKECLLSLINRQIVHVDGKINSFSSLLTFTFTENLGGYEYIPFEQFDSYEKRIYNYIYMCVAKWKGKGAFICTKNRWGDILGIHPKTAEKYVNECVDNGLIYKRPGDFTSNEKRKGQKSQEPNQYKIVPFTEEEKSNIQKKKEKENTLNLDAGIDKSWGETNEFPFPTGNWLVQGNELDEHDYVIYLKHKKKNDHLSKDFISKCNETRNRLDKNGNFKKYNEKKLIELAKEEMKGEEKQLADKLKEQATEIIDKTNDVALLVNGQIISHAEWNQLDKVEDVYGYYGKQESNTPDGMAYVVERYPVSDNQDVEMYRPKKDGKWRNYIDTDLENQAYEDERMIGIPSDFE
ncbi:hypothetical protein ACQ4XT_11440 [Halobacillus faecis]